ncbi:hypothetical protein ONE63_006116 [Megalurothrips usitatus]|uniref:Uncharacterized protein n=1 Tax=Megalurothrips usitatus TaxID=439358 RepID=A0AAV7XWF1_9NEOP|nr:hypothetical protein ONE63_006116 [Megalurothrips usitatus]
MKAFCYTACFLQTTMVLKNNKVDAKMFKAQVKKMMQEEDAQRVIAAFGACEGTPVGPEPCETTGNFIRCVKEHDPVSTEPAATYCETCRETEMTLSVSFSLCHCHL